MEMTDTVGALDQIEIEIDQPNTVAQDGDFQQSLSFGRSSNVNTERADEVPKTKKADVNSSANGSRNGVRKRHGARNQHRHKFFVKWLLETFDFLSKHGQSNDNSDFSSAHILDVAGGKGEVAARLCMCHGQQVVMVDPRPADIVHCFESLVLPKIPNKWQHRLTEQQSDNPNFIQDTIHARFQQLVTTFDNDRLTESEELQAAVQESSLILGLHADGATEAIVSAALQYEKAFVVVPCCVFPNLFHQRRVLDPETRQLVPVRSHEQFCQYLLAKDPRFRLEILPFEGRNVAIWWDGK